MKMLVETVHRDLFTDVVKVTELEHAVLIEWEDDGQHCERHIPKNEFVGIKTVPDIERND